MNKQELRTRYEREYFVSADTKKGKLKQNYAIWLEEEYLKAINHTHCCESDSEQLKCCTNCIFWSNGEGDDRCVLCMQMSKFKTF